MSSAAPQESWFALADKDFCRCGRDSVPVAVGRQCSGDRILSSPVDPPLLLCLVCLLGTLVLLTCPGLAFGKTPPESAFLLANAAIRFFLAFFGWELAATQAKHSDRRALDYASRVDERWTEVFREKLGGRSTSAAEGY